MRTPVFDIGDTLVPSKRLQNDVISGELGTEVDFPLNDLRIYNPSDVEKFLKEKGYSSDAERIVEEYKRRERRFLEENNVFELLKELSQLGKIGFISDNSVRGKEFTLKLLEENNVDFEGFVVSEEVGVEKPDRRMFEEFLDRRSEKAENFAYIGNNVPRDRGCEKVGMKFIWLDQYETFGSEYRGTTIHGLDLETLKTGLSKVS